MDPLLIGVTSGLIGLALGVFGMLAFSASERVRRLMVDVGETALPVGSVEVLSVAGKAFIVIDVVDGVVRASSGAYAFGLVKGHTVVHQQLLDLAHRVRRDGVIEEHDLVLQRAVLPATTATAKVLTAERNGPPRSSSVQEPLAAAILSRGALSQEALSAGTLVIRVRVAPLGAEYILLLAEDRTEIARTEAVRNDFVANVSHELKTPVGAISLLAEALESSPEDEAAVRRFASRMMTESARLAGLVQEIIELSRLQSADVTQAGSAVDLNTVIAGAVERTRLLALDKNVTLAIAPRQEVIVHGDSSQLITALRNLIENAVCYSAENTSVGIAMSVADGVASISVSDQGIGMSPHDQERVFERFYRVDAARSRHTGGTGLGLSIVKHIVSNHGGEVTLWSCLDVGSTFTVRLPQFFPSSDSVAPTNYQSQGAFYS